MPQLSETSIWKIANAELLLRQADESGGQSDYFNALTNRSSIARGEPDAVIDAAMEVADFLYPKTPIAHGSGPDLQPCTLSSEDIATELDRVLG